VERSARSERSDITVCALVVNSLVRQYDREAVFESCFTNHVSCCEKRIGAIGASQRQRSKLPFRSEGAF
jgi:hypothetical protein